VAWSSSTPTLSDGHVYTLGATGIVNALDAGDGAVVWSRNVATDTSTEIPYWGFSGSPVVAGEVVIAAAAGTLVAYDRFTGDPRWTGPAGGVSYSSPHLLTIDGAEQVLLLVLSEKGALALVEATSNRFTELARMAAIEGKTWNHRYWSVTSCWFATTRRWPPSGCLADQLDRPR
jgi:hypothetical protein